MSYNILGDRNAKKHRDLYTLVPSEYMIWDRRKKLICEELIGLDPDIICLQVSRNETYPSFCYLFCTSILIFCWSDLGGG